MSKRSENPWLPLCSKRLRNVAHCSRMWSYFVPLDHANAWLKGVEGLSSDISLVALCPVSDSSAFPGRHFSLDAMSCDSIFRVGPESLQGFSWCFMEHAAAWCGRELRIGHSLGESMLEGVFDVGKACFVEGSLAARWCEATVVSLRVALQWCQAWTVRPPGGGLSRSFSSRGSRSSPAASTAWTVAVSREAPGFYQQVAPQRGASDHA